MGDEKSGRVTRLPWEDQTTGTNLPDSSVRLPLIGNLPVRVQNEIVAVLGEFVGTFMFLVFSYGATTAVNIAPAANGGFLGTDPARLLYISLSFGLSLAVNAWIFFRISGGLFNPAVTVALMLVGAVTPGRAGLVIISQVLAATVAAAVVGAMLPGPLKASVSLGGDTSIVQGFFIEMMLTLQLVLTILMLAVEKHKATFVAPLGIGMSLFLAEMLGVAFTGGGVNPARSFGPSAITGFDSYHWLYWIGPLIGAIIAAGFYRLLKLLQYQRANPYQDSDGVDRVAFDAATFVENNIAYYHRGLINQKGKGIMAEVVGLTEKDIP